MGKTFEDPTFEPMDEDSRLPPFQSSSYSSLPYLLPAELWNMPYITHSPEILKAARMADPSRVSQLFAASDSKSSPAPSNSVIPSSTFHSRAPPIAPYDGSPKNLRSFCSQLCNQIQGEQFASEEDKVRFAYQCLGPGALAKMRSSFRHLEDSSIPQEINSLAEFLEALRQRCQDPGLEEQEKSSWKVMLRRRLSPKLKDALVMAPDIPDDYHAFVIYLRQKDAGFAEARATKLPTVPSTLSSTHYQFPMGAPKSFPVVATLPAFRKPAVSQGGTAMDLDMLSRQKEDNGKLTQQAKDARRALGRCVWCNTPGHIAIDCPLGTRAAAFMEPLTHFSAQEGQLKDQLQR